MGQQRLTGQFQTRTLTVPLGPNGPAAAVNAAGAGTIAWGFPGAGSAQAALAANQTTQYLSATGFGFSVPANAVILGVTLTVTKVASAGTTVFDSSAGATGFPGVRLQNAGAPLGADHSIAGQYPAGAPAPTVYGGGTDTWGAALTPAIVNSPTFGFLFAAFNGGGGATGTATLTGYTLTVAYGYSGADGVAIADTPTAISTYTAGAVALQAVPFQPDLMSRWQLLSWSLSYLGGLLYPNSTITAYGRLGAFWAGLVLGSHTNPISPNPWSNPVTPFPGDMSTFAKVWDGATDPPFPAVTSPTPPAYDGYTNGFAQPLTIQPGDQLTLGLWLTPALVQNCQTLIKNVNYTIAYDDGIE